MGLEIIRDIYGPSMRPRVFPAEDRRATGPDRPGRGPSMRPRVFPAEDDMARLTIATTCLSSRLQ